MDVLRPTLRRRREGWGTRARWARDAQGGAPKRVGSLEVGVAVLGELTAQRDAEDDYKRTDGWDEEEIHDGPLFACRSNVVRCLERGKARELPKVS